MGAAEWSEEDSLREKLTEAASEAVADYEELAELARQFDASALVFEETRHRVLQKYLSHAGVCTSEPFDGEPFSSHEAADFRRLGEIVGALVEPQEITCGAVALYHRFWTGRHAAGPLLALATRTVST